MFPPTLSVYSKIIWNLEHVPKTGSLFAPTCSGKEYYQMADDGISMVGIS